jgi:hypothetical protein
VAEQANWPPREGRAAIWQAEVVSDVEIDLASKLAGWPLLAGGLSRLPDSTALCNRHASNDRRGTDQPDAQVSR